MSTLLMVFCQENQINCSSGTEEEWNIMSRKDEEEKVEVLDHFSRTKYADLFMKMSSENAFSRWLKEYFLSLKSSKAAT